MEIPVRKATEEDARRVAAALRESDRLEIEALNLDPAFALMDSFAGSDEAYAAYVDGEAAMIFGVGETMFSDEAFVWALGTDVCNRAPLAMVRIGRAMVGRFLETYPRLTNWCDARYDKTIKWLRLLGFTIGDPEPYGAKGALFRKLSIQRKEA